MESGSFFQRLEQKYLLDEPLYMTIRNEFSAHMTQDQYGNSQISSVYFDTPSHQLIRQSLEKPAYKEELRLRCYGTPAPQVSAFVELKKKYKGTVYKRRVEMPLQEAEAYLYRGCRPGKDCQILREVDYMRRFYGGLVPSVYIGYERLALYSLEDPNLRVTFDWNLLWRSQNLHLGADSADRPLLSEKQFLMEIKLAGAMPMWMVTLFDKYQVFPTSFSKYGTAYQKIAAQGGFRKTAEVSLANGVKKGLIICA